MAERCNLCGYHGGQHSDECFAIRSQLRASEAECERLRRVVEAQAKVLVEAEGMRWNGLLTALGGVNPYAERYDAAKAELERVKLPPQPQPSERVEDAADGEDDEGRP